MEDLNEVGKVLEANYKKMLAERDANPNVFDAERELSTSI